MSPSRLCLGLAAVAMIAVPATGQILGKSLSRGLSQADLAAIAPVVRTTLGEAKVGEARPWQGDGGDAGNVRLIAGGAAAGATCGKVRISAIKAGVEHRGYVFRYCRDHRGAWRLAG